MDQLAERVRVWERAQRPGGPGPTDALWTAEERRWARKARAIAPELQRRGAALDREPDLALRRDQSFDAFRLLWRLGIHRLKVRPHLGVRARCVLLEELARADPGAAMGLVANWQCAETLAAIATPLIARKWLNPYLSDTTGRWHLASGLTEPGLGSDTINFPRDPKLTTTAKRVRGGFVLRGRKWMIGNAGAAGGYVVFAQRPGTSGYSGRVVAAFGGDAKGLSFQLLGKRGLRTATFAAIELDDVFVGTDQVYVCPNLPARQRIPAQEAGLAPLVAECAAIAIGAGRAAVELATRYATMRKQGGTEIARHQAVILRLAEIAGGVDGARAQVWQAAELCDLGRHHLAMAAAARASAVEAARVACHVTTNLFGSPGIVDAHPVDKLARDAETLAIVPGTNDFLRLLAAHA